MFSDKTGERKKITRPFSAVFYDNRICELIHAILHLTDTHAVSPSQSPEVKHTYTHNANWHFLNVNNTSPAPPNLEKNEEREKEKTEEKCQATTKKKDRLAGFIITHCSTLFVFISLPFLFVHFQMNLLITQSLICSPWHTD